MSEQNIYKEHYELQQTAANLDLSLRNIYAQLHPLVAPHGVQLSLQEVINLVAQQLQKVSEATCDHAVAAEVEAAVPVTVEDEIEVAPLRKN